MTKQPDTGSGSRVTVAGSEPQTKQKGAEAMGKVGFEG